MYLNDRQTSIYVYIAPLVIKFTSLRLVVCSWSKACLSSFAQSALSISTQDVFVWDCEPKGCEGKVPRKVWNQRAMDMHPQNHRRRTLEVFQTVHGVCLRDAPTEDRHLWTFSRRYRQRVALVSETTPQKTDTWGCLADSVWHLSQRCTHGRQTPWMSSRQCVALVSEMHPGKTDTCRCLADGMWRLSQRCTHRRQTPADV